MKKFHLEMSDPRPVAQGAVGDQAWGHYQFPSIGYTNKGNIMCGWSYGSDTIEGGAHEGGVKPPYVSKDGGVTWGPNEDNETSVKWIMPDGKQFLGFTALRGAHKMPQEYFEPYTPGTTWDDGAFRTYFAEDLGRTEDTIVQAKIFDPATGETEVYEPVIHWPYAPVTCWSGNRIYPLSLTFAINNAGIILRDGVFYMSLYMFGFDSNAKTREEAPLSYGGNYTTVYVFTSEDCARTWKYQSMVYVTEEIYKNSDSPATKIWTDAESTKFEGFGEPLLEKMPDGSFTMLMRTGHLRKSYIVHSTDNCKTWSKPVVFDEIGVFPQILTLKCGVTLAAYGRPDMRLRATADPAGIQWEDPILVDIYGMKVGSFWFRSCFYTHFLPVDDNTALWVYSDFQYPNKDGEGVKTVVVREIKVVED